MKPLKLSLRFWILISSIFSFLVGWGLFSHAGKPTPFQMFTSQSGDPTKADNTTDPQSSSVTTLPPIPSLDSLLTNNSNSAGGSSLSTGQFNVQRVQIPTVDPNLNSNNNANPIPMPQFPTRRIHTHSS